MSGRTAPGWSPPPTDVALRLILVRHGETELTSGRRYSGRGDVRLSQRGAEQAKAVATRLAGLVPAAEAVLSSPLQRCLTTAEAIAGAVGHDQVTVEADLVECDFGAWEGLGFAEVTERYPAELAAWLGSPAVAPPGGESFRDVGERVDRFVTQVRQRYGSGVVIAVSHVSPIKLILRDALAAGDAFLHRCYLTPTGVSTIDFYGDGAIAVRAVNETAHLDRLS